MPRVVVLLLTLLAFTPAAPAQFVTPDDHPDNAPAFGIPGAIHVGLHPAAFDDRDNGGPRGLIRIGLEHDGRLHLVNYIAIEPVVAGRRGLSELERSADGQRGKRFTLEAPPGAAGVNDKPWTIEGEPGARSLRFMIRSERFANGAEPLIEVTLFEQRPLEVRFRTFAGGTSAPIESLVLTSTMGNQSRCRLLWLEKRCVSARSMFTHFHSNGFADHPAFSLDDMLRTPDGGVVTAITSDEHDPREVLPFANGAWRCTNPPLTQYWRKDAGDFDEGLRVRVNGRRAYWASKAPIPFGPSIENFELLESFQPGRASWFGLTLDDPQRLGFTHAAPETLPTTRTIPPLERARIERAADTNRSLENPDFTDAFAGWQRAGGASSFRVFAPPGVPGSKRMTTYGPGGDTDVGRLYQCFVVPEDATELRLFVHGGADPSAASIGLWDAEKRIRWATGRNSNDPFEIRWDIRNQRGRVLTLEIVDGSRDKWGFIGVHGIELVRE